MRREHQHRSSSVAPAGQTIRLLIGGALISWAVSAVLVFAVIPLLLAQAAFSSYADDVRFVMGGFAVAGAVAGALMLAGVGLTVRAPARATGRIVLLVAGLVLTAAGLLLASVGTLQLGWSGAAALIGMLCAAMHVVVGLLAAGASLSNGIPGRSLVDRMTTRAGADVPPPRRDVLLALTAALMIAWVLCASLMVGRTTDSFWVWVAGVWVMPILGGLLATGWRSVDPNRLKTLAVASATGSLFDLLLLLVLGLGYYQFNASGFAMWWAVMGALFGALGYWIWGVIRRIGAPAAIALPRTGS